jgi:hypothetical protein
VNNRCVPLSTGLFMRNPCHTNDAIDGNVN